MKRLINSLSDDAMPGDQFQKHVSELGNKAHTQLSSQAGDRDFGLALYQVKEALDDAMERSMGVATRKRYQEARHKWRILKALDARGALHERGDVSASTLAGYFGRTDKAGYKRGGNVENMYESLRAARRFSDMVGSSGTAERSSLNPLIAAGPRCRSGLRPRHNFHGSRRTRGFCPNIPASDQVAKYYFRSDGRCW
jgi:hypothetical protein